MARVTEPSVDAASAAPAAAARPRRRRGFHVALGLLALLVATLLVLIWAHFGTFNPRTGRLNPSEHPLFFPVLMVHIAGSTVAIVTCVLQVWPWLRRKHLRVHRMSGRLYVFAGVYPAALASLAIVAFWPYSPLTGASDILLSFLWLGITTYGYVLIRRHRVADHRRWMLRSFALTASTLINQVLGPPLGLVLKPLLDTNFAGSTAVLDQTWSGIDGWLGWTLAFIAVEWWLEREQLRRSARR
jgi:uncharacterized membrane protein YozB (DUF420 family)